MHKKCYICRMQVQHSAPFRKKMYMFTGFLKWQINQINVQHCKPPNRYFSSSFVQWQTPSVVDLHHFFGQWYSSLYFDRLHTFCHFSNQNFKIFEIDVICEIHTKKTFMIYLMAYSTDKYIKGAIWQLLEIKEHVKAFHYGYFAIYRHYTQILYHRQTGLKDSE